MGMSGTALGDAIANAIIALDPDMTSDQQNQLKTAWEDIGQAMVTYITANAVVNTNDTGTVTGGPVAGSPVSATGVGTVS